MNKINVAQSAGCNMARKRGLEEDLKPHGRFVVEHIRNGAVIGKYDFPNAITNEGKNKLLDVMFHNVAAIATWYIALVDGAGSPTLAAGDTYAQINGTNGWDEFVNYDEATRPEWTEGAAAAQSITNASPVVFNISATGSVYGLAIVGGGSAAPTKSDVAGGGTLWAAAAFASGTVAVLDNDQLKVTYTVNA
jgi:hypothetical protein